jgi:hypothetical protein
MKRYEAEQIVIEKWRVECNTLRAHSALCYGAPTAAACMPWEVNPTSQPMVIQKLSRFFWIKNSARSVRLRVSFYRSVTLKLWFHRSCAQLCESEVTSEWDSTTKSLSDVETRAN